MIKKALIGICFIAFAPVVSLGQCAFPVKNTKESHNQYSKSPEKLAQQSKKQMDAQKDAFFTKKKYQQDVKGKKKVVRKAKTKLRYY